MSEKLLEVVRLYKDGLCQEAIAERLGLGQSAVSSRMQRFGLTQRMIKSMLRSGLTPEQIVARVTPTQETLPLDALRELERVKAENADLRKQLSEARSVMAYASEHLCQKAADFLNQNAKE